MEHNNGMEWAYRFKQKQKGNRKFPPASIFASGLRSENSLRKYKIFYQKWPIVNVIFVSIT